MISDIKNKKIPNVVVSIAAEMQFCAILCITIESHSNFLQILVKLHLSCCLPYRAGQMSSTHKPRKSSLPHKHMNLRLEKQMQR